MSAKGEAAYAKHVAAQKFPRRYKPWGRLTEAQQAEFAPAAKKPKAKKAKGGKK